MYKLEIRRPTSNSICSVKYYETEAKYQRGWERQRRRTYYTLIGYRLENLNPNGWVEINRQNSGINTTSQQFTNNHFT